MNVTCFTDSAVQEQLHTAISRHVSTDVSAVIAAKQEAPSIEAVVRHGDTESDHRRLVNRDIEQLFHTQKSTPHHRHR